VTNRALWTLVNSAFTDEDASRAWAAGDVTWGLFHVPERDVRVLGDVRGLDVIELGCGTAYLSAWLARRALDRSVSTSPPPKFTPQPVVSNASGRCFPALRPADQGADQR
jgi:hypothetical protein